MDLTSGVVIQELFKKYQFQPSKRFGQNFLIDKGVLRKIIEAAEISSKEVILEIGSGIGNLTQELAKKAKRVIAIEKDSKLIGILNNELRIKGVKNVKVIQRDVLKIPNSEFQIINSYKVVANLPYYIVSPVIRKFLESKVPPNEMVLMVQKEVAQRICAKLPDMSLLAVSVQFYAEPKIISFVPKTSFWPQPKVDSAIIKIIPRKSAYSIGINQLLFFKIVRAGFSQPRKQILNNLSKMLKLDKETVKSWLLKTNIQPTQRAETLCIEDWIKLSKNFKINR
jgi:16S rRNA (adenine1518-N6/adenine1519-N6)-dimethyltransferase